MGVRGGLFVAGVYSLLLIVARGLMGAEFADRVGMSLPLALGALLGSCVLGGIIAGLLLPVGRWAIGAMLVGYLAVMPAFFVFTKAGFSPLTVQ